LLVSGELDLHFGSTACNDEHKIHVEPHDENMPQRCISFHRVSLAAGAGDQQRKIYTSYVADLLFSGDVRTD
jgi:hypothetical protein